jgi:DNA polymerase-4
MGSELRSGSSGRQIPWDRAGDERENKRPRYLHIFTWLDMRNQTLEFMIANFDKAGTYYYWISRGIDIRPVRANRVRKSVGAENTFSQDLADYEALAAELQPLTEKVWLHCETTGARGRTATLKVKFSDFELITRSRSVAGIDSASDLSSLALELLKQLMPPKRAIRLLGLSVSGFYDPEVEDQLPLKLDGFCVRGYGAPPTSENVRTVAFMMASTCHPASS